MAALGLLDNVRVGVSIGGGKLVLVVDVGEGLHQPDGGHGASVRDVLGSTLLIFLSPSSIDDPFKCSTLG
jgi:hypothetical protein